MELNNEWYINWTDSHDGGFYKSETLTFRHVKVTIAYPVKAPTNRAPLLAIATCPLCNHPNIQPISRRALKDIKDWGASNCLDLKPSLRELFMTGICDECWPDEPDE